jgi:hypothetical protein
MMAEDTALKLAVIYFIGHAYSVFIEDHIYGGDEEWLSIVKERVQALMPFIEKNKLSCLTDAERILKL